MRSWVENNSSNKRDKAESANNHARPRRAEERANPENPDTQEDIKHVKI